MRGRCADRRRWRGGSRTWPDCMHAREFSRSCNYLEYEIQSEGVDKPLLILHGEIHSPPFSEEARRWTGFLLRRLQQGYLLGMPDSRPMPSIGTRCHELRVDDPERRTTWRIMYRIDGDAIVVADISA